MAEFRKDSYQSEFSINMHHAINAKLSKAKKENNLKYSWLAGVLFR